MKDVAETDYVKNRIGAQVDGLREFLFGLTCFAGQVYDDDDTADDQREQHHH